MKRLQFDYHMKLSFDDYVKNHRFSLKCVPHDTDLQKIENMIVEVYPDNVTSEDTDAYGNITLFGYTNELHDSFGFDVKGVAVTGREEYEKADEIHKIGIFKYHTKKTKPGTKILEFYQKLDLKRFGTATDKATAIMDSISESFQYVKGTTGMDTTAEEAFAGGQGVCQDYAHIMLSLCRMERIPCRYVTGMMLGEGLSHAWIEIWDEGRWIGYDPTNRKMVGDEYIKISNGRDSEDCLVNQGIFTGNVTQMQDINVVVEEVFDDRIVGIN